jgi:hypothetical protein
MPVSIIGAPMAADEKTVRVSVKDSVLENLSLNDKVTLAIKGTIKELEASRSYGEGEDKETYEGQVILLVKSVKVATPNAFANLAEADVGDDDDG